MAVGTSCYSGFKMLICGLALCVVLPSPFSLPLSTPPFHSDHDHEADCISGLSTSQSTCSGLQLAQLPINAQGYDENDPRVVYNVAGSNIDGSITERIIGGQGYGGNDATYSVDEYGCDGSGAGVVPYSSMSQVAVASSVVGLQASTGDFGAQNMAVYNAYPYENPVAQSQPTTNASTSALQLTQHNSPCDPLHATQGPEDFEQRFQDMPYGPIPHASIQFSNRMCFRAQRRTVNHRSAPYSIVYRQERSQGPIYNGSIHGNVHNFQISNIDGVLEYLKEHAATGAMHDSNERLPPPLCHPGTRDAVIHLILDWYGYQARPDKPIMWVYAPAGYGKTTIAGTVSERLEANSRELNFNPLGATFFFWRTSTERNSPARFIITLAYQLFISIPEIAPHIKIAVKQNPMILTKTLEVQLKKLIIEPFQALGDTNGMLNRLIIIDGLDECINSDRESRVVKKYAEDQETAQIRVLDLIRSLASYQLPLSFLILSRPEVWIKQHIESASFENLVEHVDLYKVVDHLKDVETFVKAELSRLGLDEEDLVTGLVERANGHMLYASTVIRHVDCPYDDPQTRLKNILTDYSNYNPDLAHSTPFASLYELYRQILRSCPEGNRSLMMDVIEEIYAGSFCFAVGVGVHQAVGVFDRIFGRVPGAGMKAIRGLHAVLRSSSGDGPATETFFIHRSFPECLSDPGSLHEFHLDWEKGLRRLLLGCLHSLSSITLSSRVDEDHLRFALVSWPSLCVKWMAVYKSAQPDTAGYCGDVVGMVGKLMDVDLKACFVHTFTLDFPFLLEMDPSSGLCHDNSSNYIITEACLAIYESNPGVKRAVSHVVNSHKAAILHLLHAHTLQTGKLCLYFPQAVHEHLWELSNRFEGWDSDSVVHALKTLRQMSSDLFDSLMADVEGNSQRDLEEGLYNHEGNQRVQRALRKL
ncbi:hypothetical protein H1R20_g14389, partial [Candolleomyces eurysporus]